MNCVTCGDPENRTACVGCARRDLEGMISFQSKFIQADHEKRALELQLGEARRLLAKAEDQGLFHCCGSEGYIPRSGCPECEEGLESQILKFLGASVEKMPTEKPKCVCGGVGVGTGCVPSCPAYTEKLKCDHDHSLREDGRRICELCGDIEKRKDAVQWGCGVCGSLNKAMHYKDCPDYCPHEVIIPRCSLPGQEKQAGTVCQKCGY